MHDHDFKEFPELTNNRLAEHQFSSPHVQITEDFTAEVVKVHDGDTITLRTDFRDFDFPLRFLDIDAPEMNAGGETARDWLSDRILNKTVEIKIRPNNRVDKWGRLLGTVIADGVDIGDDELRIGLATPFTRRREEQLPSLEKMFALKQWV